MADANADAAPTQAPPPSAAAPPPPPPAAPQQQQAPSRVGPWVLERQIGAGSFATVWRARHERTGEQAAVKAVDRARLAPKLRESLASEVAVLRGTRHPNVVRLLDLIEEPPPPQTTTTTTISTPQPPPPDNTANIGRLYLVLEYCSGGDLAQWLRRHGRAPPGAAQYLLRQLAAGLRELRRHHVVHRDLKPQNLLLSDASARPVLKIADFGFARPLLPGGGLAETLCGSPLYMAPEILRFTRYDAKADLWSVGAVLYELLAGRPPYSGANHVALLRAIDAAPARLPRPVALRCGEGARLLLEGLLQRDPVARMTFDEFFAHPWLRSGEGEDGGEGGEGDGGAMPPAVLPAETDDTAAGGAAAGDLRWPAPVAAATAAPTHPSAATQAPAEEEDKAEEAPRPLSPPGRLLPLPPSMMMMMGEGASLRGGQLSSGSLESDYVLIPDPCATTVTTGSADKGAAAAAGAGGSKGVAAAAVPPATTATAATPPQASSSSSGKALVPAHVAAAVAAAGLPRGAMPDPAARARAVAAVLAAVAEACVAGGGGGGEGDGGDGDGENATAQSSASLVALKLLALRLVDALCCAPPPDQGGQAPLPPPPGAWVLEGGAPADAARALASAAAILRAAAASGPAEPAPPSFDDDDEEEEGEDEGAEDEEGEEGQEEAPTTPTAAAMACLFRRALRAGRDGAAAEVAGDWAHAAAGYALCEDLLVFLAADWSPPPAAAAAGGGGGALLPGAGAAGAEQRDRMAALEAGARARLAACAGKVEAVRAD